MQIKTVSDFRQQKIEHQETLAMRAAVSVIRSHDLQEEFAASLREIALQEGESDLANMLAPVNGKLTRV